MHYACINSSLICLNILLSFYHFQFQMECVTTNKKSRVNLPRNDSWNHPKLNVPHVLNFKLRIMEKRKMFVYHKNAFKST